MIYCTLFLLTLLIARMTDGTTSRQQSDIVTMVKYIEALRSIRPENAMLQVDRKNYVEEKAYDNAIVRIGYGAHFPTPEMHAVALEAFDTFVIEGSKVLDVGSGSGYMTACLALMAGKTGYVIGIDHIPELVEKAKENVRNDNPLLMEENRTRFVVADGIYGYVEDAPYDAIHVGGLIEGGYAPEVLQQQLKERGRLVMISDRGNTDDNHPLYEFIIVDKDKHGRISTEAKREVGFFEKLEPITTKKEQLATLYSRH